MSFEKELRRAYSRGINRHAANDARTGTPREEGTFREPSEELDRLASAVIGAAIEVHRALGPGFLESVYEEALTIEFGLRGIAFERQKIMPIFYKGTLIAEPRIDLLVGAELVVELKAVEGLNATHMAQVLSYLKAGAFQLGLLINFNVPLLKHGVRRVISSS